MKHLQQSKTLGMQMLISVAMMLPSLSAMAAFTPFPQIANQKTNLKVLLLSADHSEPQTAAWEAWLRAEGVPFDEIVLCPGNYLLYPNGPNVPASTPGNNYNPINVYAPTPGPTATQNNTNGINNILYAPYNSQVTFNSCAQAGNATNGISIGNSLISAQNAKLLYDATTNTANYEAVVIGYGGLFPTGGVTSALTAGEWSALYAYESQRGIRQVTASAFPSPTYGLALQSSGALDNVTATLTASGLTTFPYLKGPVLMDPGTYGYLATPVNANNFNTLLTYNSSVLLGIYSQSTTNSPADLYNRQEMVATFNYNGFQMQSNLLMHGMLSWATNNVYLGYDRKYLALHADDIFLPDDYWCATGDTTNGCSGHTHTTVDGTLRMNKADLDNTIKWQKAQGLTLTFLFNGGGYVEYGANDQLNKELLSNRGQFLWLNHTYSHPDLDADPETNLGIPATTAILESEIKSNIDFAKQHKIPFTQTELCNGGHTGVLLPGWYPNIDTISKPVCANATATNCIGNMPQALADTGILFIGDDVSYRPTQWRVGSELNPSVTTSKALTVPRWPTNVYYNAATMAQQLDEYNWLYSLASGHCVNTPTTTCFNNDADWPTYLKNSAAQIITHVITNDPRPHFMHQSNLIRATFPSCNANAALPCNTILFQVVNSAISLYKTYFNFTTTPFVQLNFTQIGQLLQTRLLWKKVAVNKPSVPGVTAYVLNKVMYLSSNVAGSTSVPITGPNLTFGSSYEGLYSKWVTLNNGQTLAFRM